MSVRRGLVGFLTMLAASLVAMSPVRASLVQALDLAALVERADEVVLATVRSAVSHYDDHGRIVTDVQMQVERSEKGGRSAGTMVTVRRLGGTVGDIGMRIEGEPSFEDGETVLLFGTRVGPTQLLRPVGMSQGALRVVEENGDRWVRSATAGAALVARSSSGQLLKAQAALEQPRRLDDLLAEIRTLVRGQK